MSRFRYIYGPVPSRRLGLSLGIDSFPDEKNCTFNCVYCQLGAGKPVFAEGLLNEPRPESVISEIEDFFKGNVADFATFSGNGEPTLWSGVGDVLEFLRSKIPSVRRAVLTNGSMLWHPHVRDVLLLADVVVPTVSAGDDETFQKLHRPNELITFKMWLEGIRAFSREFSGEIWAEVMLVSGVNDSDEQLRKIREILDDINPSQIDINTPVRPPAEKWAHPPDSEKIKSVVKIFGEKTRIVGKFAHHSVKKQLGATEIAEKILAILRRRPEKAEDIAKSLGVNSDTLQQSLSFLLGQNVITEENGFLKITGKSKLR